MYRSERELKYKVSEDKSLGEYLYPRVMTTPDEGEIYTAHLE
jgi:hypothetical protein